MPLIFVDANIFLAPYRRKMPAYREVLRKLISLKPHLFITATVRDEVERSRVKLYRDSIPTIGDKLENEKAFKFPEIHPHHSDDGDFAKELRTRSNDLIKRYRQLIKEYNTLIDEHKRHHETNLISIAHGQDDVTRILSPLFDGAVAETPEQLARARLRRERGQPPGKDRNVLGDQISWEQICDAVADKTELWIVSDDGDFADRLGDELILKPTLRREIARNCGAIKTLCFDDLPGLLDVVRESGLVDEDQLPSPETVNAAKQEIIDSGGDASPPYDPCEIWPATPSPCPRSPDGRHHARAPAPRPSRFSQGWTFHGMCSRCGELVDTGEPYEE